MYFSTGKGTIVDPLYIEYMNQPPGLMDGVKVVQLNEDHRLFLQGEFGNFKIYCLVTHSRVEIVPDSVQRISLTHFSARIKLELSESTITEHDVVFLSPIQPFTSVKASQYGVLYDSFEFRYGDSGSESFQCDLSFLTQYCENLPLIPLNVEYIGVAKSDKREAQDRLGEGHNKLQTLLAAQNRRQSRQTTSVILYRPSEIKPPFLPFSEVIEIIEATMIQYFKPKPLNIKGLNFPYDSPYLSSRIKYLGERRIQTLVTSPRGTALCSRLKEPMAEHNIFVDMD